MIVVKWHNRYVNTTKTW